MQLNNDVLIPLHRPFEFYRNGRLEASLDSTDPADLEVFIKTMSKEEEFDNLEVNVPNLE